MYFAGSLSPPPSYYQHQPPFNRDHAIKMRMVTVWRRQKNNDRRRQVFFVVEPFLSLSPWELAAMSSLAQWWPEWEGWVFCGLSWLCLKKRGVGSAGSLRWWQDGDEFLVARGASGGSLRLLSGLSPPNALQAHTRRAKEPFPHPLTWLWTWKREGIRS